MEGYVLTALFSAVIGLFGFILLGQRADIKTLNEKVNALQTNCNDRIGKIEVSQSEVKSDIKYIRESFDSLKTWIQNGQKGPL